MGKKEVYAMIVIVIVILLSYLAMTFWHKKDNSQSEVSYSPQENLSVQSYLQNEINNSNSSSNETSYLNETQEDKSPGEEDFFSRVNLTHWGHMPLLVFINQSVEIKLDPKENKKTVDLRVKQIREAMSRLSSAVKSIQFNETNESETADITFEIYMPIALRQNLSAGKKEGTNTGGLSIPFVYGKLITNATVYVSPVGLGEKEECTSSDLALHELLHSFGIDHDSDWGALMSANSWTSECSNNPISKTNIDILKGIYG